MNFSAGTHSIDEALRSFAAEVADTWLIYIHAETYDRITGLDVVHSYNEAGPEVGSLTDAFDRSEWDRLYEYVEQGRRVSKRVQDVKLASGASAQVAIFAIDENAEILCVAVLPAEFADGSDESHDEIIAAALTLSEEEFRLLAEALPMGVFVWGAFGVIKFSNQRGRELLGLDLLDAQEWYQAFPEEDWERIQWATAQLPQTRGFDLEARVRRIDGKTRWCRLIVRDVRAKNGALLSAIGLIEDITEQRKLRTALEAAATSDALTGLPNRVALIERLEEVLARDPLSLSVLFIDLDGFKLVNDTLGHTMGDRLLETVADRFERSIRPSDLVARFGGDEFVVVAESRGRNAPLLLADRIHDVLAEPVLVGDRPVDVTASIGIARAEGPLSSPDQLLGDADLAMYAAKHAGRNRTVVYNPGLREAAAQEFDIITDLRHAIERDQVQLFYQPIYDLTTHRAVGIEALIRWEHPSYGRLLPNAFIRLAEENGLINMLGDWALRQACTDLAHLRREQLVDDSFFVSVNVSMLQLSEVNDLIATAEAAVASCELRPSHILFELTESIPLDAIPQATAQINELNARGFRLAVDDFGTGYSSLEYLTLLPFDVLKIDPSFTSRLDAPGAAGAAEAVLESLVHLSDRLSFDLICEGIESADQLDSIVTSRVSLGQGYYFARPTPFSRLRTILAAADLRTLDLTDPAPIVTDLPPH